MRTIYDGRFYALVIDESRNALSLTWKPSTTDVGDDDFQEALSNFAGFAIEYRPRGLIVDFRSFAGRVSSDLVGAWRDQQIVPRYNKADASKMAILTMPGSALPVSPPERHSGQAFKSAVFDSEEAMYQWLSE